MFQIQISFLKNRESSTPTVQSPHIQQTKNHQQARYLQRKHC